MSRFASCALGERRFAALVDGDAVRPLRGIAELGRETPAEVLADPPLSDERVPLAEVALRPVVPRPGKVLCVGLNYKAHVDEGVYDVPDYPALFSKFAETLVGAGEPIVLPPESEAVDYEAELAFVIGRPVRRAPATRRSRRSAATRVANDVSMRDYQYKTHQWLPGKNWASSTPLGPFLVTPDEVGDPHALDISLELNGERMQASNTRQLHLRHPDDGRDDLRVRPARARRRRAHGHAERRRLPARAEGAAAGRRPRGRGDRAGRAAREPRRRRERAERAAAVSVDVRQPRRGRRARARRVAGGEPLGRHFSVTRALPRVLDALGEAGLRATFFVEGLNAELYPDTLRGLAAAGHEVAYHGWRHEPWAELEPAAERELLERGVERAGGARPAAGRLPAARRAS